MSESESGYMFLAVVAAAAITEASASVSIPPLLTTLGLAFSSAWSSLAGNARLLINCDFCSSASSLV